MHQFQSLMHPSSIMNSDIFFLRKALKMHYFRVHQETLFDFSQYDMTCDSFAHSFFSDDFWCKRKVRQWQECYHFVHLCGLDDFKEFNFLILDGKTLQILWKYHYSSGIVHIIHLACNLCVTLCTIECRTSKLHWKSIKCSYLHLF